MKRILTCSIIVCLVLLVSCFKYDPDKAPKVTPEKTGTGEKSLILVLGDEPKTLDPLHITDMISIRTVAGLLEGLTVYNEKTLKPEAGIAEKWDISEDKLTYTFTLKDTVWSNNAPVTAYDFEQTWKDILKPDFPTVCDYAFSPIKNAEAAKKGLVPLDQVGIKALDAKTLVITLEHPTPYLLELLCSPPFSPVNIANDRKNPLLNHF